MTKSSTEQIIDIIEAYSEALPQNRDAGKTVAEIMALVQPTENYLFSEIGFAVRTAADFNAPELIAGIGAAFPLEKKAARQHVLEIFCTHAKPSWTEQTYDTVFKSFQDVLNDPSEAGTVIIFQGMQAEISGAEGMLASMVKHGANPNLEVTHSGYQTTALQLARENMMPIDENANTIKREKILKINAKWERVIDIMEGKDVGSPTADAAIRR